MCVCGGGGISSEFSKIQTHRNTAVTMTIKYSVYIHVLFVPQRVLLDGIRSSKTDFPKKFSAVFRRRTHSCVDLARAKGGRETSGNPPTGGCASPAKLSSPPSFLPLSFLAAREAASQCTTSVTGSTRRKRLQPYLRVWAAS